jgi:hypothetical protein
MFANATAVRNDAGGFAARNLRFLDGMSWRRCGWLVVAAAVFALHSVPQEIVLNGDRLDAAGADYAVSFAIWFVRYLVGFTPVLLALTVADNIRVTAARRMAVLLAALLVGAQVASLLKCVLPLGYVCAGFPYRVPWHHLLSSDSLWTAIVGGLIAVAYFHRRHDRRVAKALHAEELARVDLQRATLSANLQAMQARVEPTFLFDALGAIGGLYDRDAAMGERMLDELIQYLRAALPDVRGPSSTLGRELALARAYLALLDMSAGGRLVLDLDMTRDCADVVVPPMIILPLLAAALAPNGGAGSMPTSLRIDAHVDAGRVRILLTGHGPALRMQDGDPIVRDARERLHALYGEGALLAVAMTPDLRLTARIEVPRETA